MKLSLTKRLSAFVAVIVTFALLFSAISVPATVNAEAVEFLPFTVVFTGGMHGNVEPFDFGGESNFGGFAKAKTKIDEIRKELEEDRTWWRFGGNTLVLDVGNAIMGSKTGSLFASKNLQDVHPTIRAMNMIGYDAMVYGAGEFSMNKSIRDALVSQSDFPWITANVVVGKERKKLPKGEYVMKVYKIPTAAHPLRYGVVGLTNPAVFTWENLATSCLVQMSFSLKIISIKHRSMQKPLKRQVKKPISLLSQQISDLKRMQMAHGKKTFFGLQSRILHILTLYVHHLQVFHSSRKLLLFLVLVENFMKQ
ncbi:MAG: hypothetical protein R2883_07900 [Caldisericia bacterium]